MKTKKEKLIEEITSHIKKIPLTFYNLNEIKSKSAKFKKIKIRANKTLYSGFQVIPNYYKSISKIL